jgi:hypothetical protein
MHVWYNDSNFKHVKSFNSTEVKNQVHVELLLQCYLFQYHLVCVCGGHVHSTYCLSQHTLNAHGVLTNQIYRIAPNSRLYMATTWSLEAIASTLEDFVVDTLNRDSN